MFMMLCVLFHPSSCHGFAVHPTSAASRRWLVGFRKIFGREQLSVRDQWNDC